MDTKKVYCTALLWNYGKIETYFGVSLLEIGTSSIFLVLFNLKVARGGGIDLGHPRLHFFRTLLKQNTGPPLSVRAAVDRRDISYVSNEYMYVCLYVLYTGIYALRIIRGPINSYIYKKTNSSWLSLHTRPHQTTPDHITKGHVCHLDF